MYKIKAFIVAKKGDKVKVLNYRKKPAIWTIGLVESVEISVLSDLKVWISYRVFTDGIFITVTPDSIESLEDCGDNMVSEATKKHNESC